VELGGDEDGGVHLTLLLVRQQPNSKQGGLIDCKLFSSKKIYSKQGELIDRKANLFLATSFLQRKSKEGELIDSKLFAKKIYSKQGNLIDRKLFSQRKSTVRKVN
jgi:hypothetical protein